MKNYNVEDFDENYEIEEEDETLDNDEEETLDSKENKPSEKVETQNNEYYKQKRLQEKEEKRLMEEGRRKGLLESINYHNPYTDEDIKDDEDIEEYFTMKEMSNKGLDPLKDYAKYQKEQRRAAKARETKASSVEDDILKFRQENPDTSIDSVLQNQDFINLFGTSIGTVPLSILWKAYGEMQKKNNEQKVKEEVKMRRQQNQPGSFGGTTKATLKAKDFSKMSDEELEKEIAAAKRGVYSSQN